MPSVHSLGPPSGIPARKSRSAIKTSPPKLSCFDHNELSSNVDYPSSENSSNVNLPYIRLRRGPKMQLFQFCDDEPFLQPEFKVANVMPKYFSVVEALNVTENRLKAIEGKAAIAADKFVRESPKLSEDRKHCQFQTNLEGSKTFWKGPGSPVVPRESVPINKREPALREFSPYWRWLRREKFVVIDTISLRILRSISSVSVGTEIFVDVLPDMTVKEMKNLLLKSYTLQILNSCANPADHLPKTPDKSTAINNQKNKHDRDLPGTHPAPKIHIEIDSSTQHLPHPLTQFDFRSDIKDTKKSMTNNKKATVSNNSNSFLANDDIIFPTTPALRCISANSSSTTSPTKTSPVKDKFHSTYTQQMASPYRARENSFTDENLINVRLRLILSYKGKILEDHYKMMDYSIKNGDTLDLAVI